MSIVKPTGNPMAYINELFDTNFLEYASYVIKDRAIPYMDDGLKPVQRRILHSLFEMDDGKFNKVANVVGHAMKYHPHGDASIYSALVVLANKELFIDRQGNFGNIFTGDPASAARYIECRLTPMAREALYNPEITNYDPSYDGRNREPVVFPAKFPVVLVQGAEGIAVGMSTKILPHNFTEVLQAMKASLTEQEFTLYPDFPTGGLVDASDYSDGLGKVLVRSKVEIVDPKTVVIRELPFGSTTESLIASIDSASKKNKIMISHINDYSTDNVEIELKLKRGFQANEIIDALYAFTDCEKSISVNLLLIKDNKPVKVSVTDVIHHSTAQLQSILEQELELEKSKLLDKLHRRTLEMIFVSERIYTNIESRRTIETVKKAVVDGFKPFKKELVRALTEEDVDQLLKIPIRRISMYDIKKAKEELLDIKNRIGEIDVTLKNLIGYALEWLDKMIEKYGKNYPRRTELISMAQTSVKEAAIRDRDLIYNGQNGYMGYDLKEGPKKFKVSIYDKIFLLDKHGTYKVIDVPDKIFVGRGFSHILLADAETLAKHTFTALYKGADGVVYLKRFKIEKFITGKEYSVIPEDGELLELISHTEKDELGEYIVYLLPTGKMRKFEEVCPLENYSVKGVAAKGYKVTGKEFTKIEYRKISDSEIPEVTAGMPLFDTTGDDEEMVVAE